MDLGLRIGVDIGGSYIVAGLVRNGKVLEQHQVTTDSGTNRRHVLGQLSSAIQPLAYRARQHGQRSIDVVLAVPAPYHNGTITKCFNIPELVGVNLGEELHYDIALQRDNTAFAAHHASRAPKVLGVIVGTGISSCYAEGMPLCYGEDLHSCTARMYKDRTLDIGEVHEWLGKSAVLARHQARGGRERTLMELWASKTALAQATQAELVGYLAHYLDHAQETFSPDLIVIGGGHAQSLVPALRRKHPAYTNVLLAKETSKDTILGAVALTPKVQRHVQVAGFL